MFCIANSEPCSSSSTVKSTFFDGKQWSMKPCVGHFKISNEAIEEEEYVTALVDTVGCSERQISQVRQNKSYLTGINNLQQTKYI